MATRPSKNKDDVLHLLDGKIVKKPWQSKQKRESPAAALKKLLAPSAAPSATPSAPSAAPSAPPSAPSAAAPSATIDNEKLKLFTKFLAYCDTLHDFLGERNNVVSEDNILQTAARGLDPTYYEEFDKAKRKRDGTHSENFDIFVAKWAAKFAKELFSNEPSYLEKFTRLLKHKMFGKESFEHDVLSITEEFVIKCFGHLNKQVMIVKKNKEDASYLKTHISKYIPAKEYVLDTSATTTTALCMPLPETTVYTNRIHVTTASYLDSNGTNVSTDHCCGEYYKDLDFELTADNNECMGYNSMKVGAFNTDFKTIMATSNESNFLQLTNGDNKVLLNSRALDKVYNVPKYSEFISYWLNNKQNMPKGLADILKKLQMDGSDYLSYIRLIYDLKRSGDWMQIQAGMALQKLLNDDERVVFSSIDRAAIARLLTATQNEDERLFGLHSTQLISGGKRLVFTVYGKIVWNKQMVIEKIEKLQELYGEVRAVLNTPPLGKDVVTDTLEILKNIFMEVFNKFCQIRNKFGPALLPENSTAEDITKKKLNLNAVYEIFMLELLTFTYYIISWLYVYLDKPLNLTSTLADVQTKLEAARTVTNATLSDDKKQAAYTASGTVLTNRMNTFIDDLAANGIEMDMLSMLSFQTISDDIKGAIALFTNINNEILPSKGTIDRLSLDANTEGYITTTLVNILKKFKAVSTYTPTSTREGMQRNIKMEFIAPPGVSVNTIYTTYSKLIQLSKSNTGFYIRSNVGVECRKMIDIATAATAATAATSTTHSLDFYEFFKLAPDLSSTDYPLKFEKAINDGVAGRRIVRIKRGGTLNLEAVDKLRTMAAFQPYLNEIADEIIEAIIPVEKPSALKINYDDGRSLFIELLYKLIYHQMPQLLSLTSPQRPRSAHPLLKEKPVATHVNKKKVASHTSPAIVDTVMQQQLMASLNQMMIRNAAQSTNNTGKTSKRLTLVNTPQRSLLKAQSSASSAASAHVQSKSKTLNPRTAGVKPLNLNNIFATAGRGGSLVKHKNNKDIPNQYENETC